jgi:hypothetical protein
MNTTTMKFQVCEIKGSNDIYEDCLLINHKDRIYGVIDGATSVTPYRNDQGQTGGYLAANLLSSFFQDVPITERLSDIVLKANHELRSMMINKGVDTSCKTNLWCTVFSIFRVHEDYIEYVQTGDCMLFAKYKEGTVRNITHDQVAHLDAISLKKREEAKLHGYTSAEEVFNFVLPTIRNNRLKSNTLEGYSVMNGEPELAQFLEFGTFNRACLSKVYSITDGLFYPTSDVNTRVDWNKTILGIDEKGLKAYAESIIELEEADPLCKNYPRHKISDDKTGVVIDL